MTGNYDDIIHCERPVSKTHPRLSIAQRAAQFAPYKTLTAYHDSTDELENSSESTAYEIIPDTEYSEPAEDYDYFPSSDLDTSYSDEL